MDTIAIITSYNPNIGLLEENIKSIEQQVEKIVVYDNASKNVSLVEELCAHYSNVELIKNPDNKGVARPLYEGSLYAYQEGYRYMLTLDQDSVLPYNAVEMLKNKIESDDKIAMCGSNPNNAENSQHVNTLITSGTLAVTERIIECGNYNPDLFIDLVDYDICFKLLKKGYKLSTANEIHMAHSFGENRMISILGKKVMLQNYSEKRLYYMARNLEILRKQYPEQMTELNAFRDRLVKKVIKAVFFHNNKIQKVKAYFAGKKEGRKIS